MIEYLSRFFTVLLVNEFHTSMMCSQCGIELVARTNMIRFYECKTCKTTGKDGALIDFVVNKDTSAALGMVRICTSLFAFGFSKSRYKGTSRMISNMSKDSKDVTRNEKPTITLKGEVVTTYHI
jgi:ribosomal protein L37AE/L43A